MASELTLAEYTPIVSDWIAKRTDETKIRRMGAIRDGRFYLVPRERALDAYKVLWPGASREQLREYCRTNIRVYKQRVAGRHEPEAPAVKAPLHRYRGEDRYTLDANLQDVGSL
jgi:hypothetical protein